MVARKTLYSIGGQLVGTREDSLFVGALLERRAAWTVNTCRRQTNSGRKRGAHVIGRHEGRGSLEDNGVHARR